MELELKQQYLIQSDQMQVIAAQSQFIYVAGMIIVIGLLITLALTFRS